MFLYEEREMWQQRPCPVPLLKVMALSVIHLQPLRLVLLDALMIDYMTLVDSYISTSHYKPDDLQHISMVSNSQMIVFVFIFFFNSSLPQRKNLVILTLIHTFSGVVVISLRL